MLDLVALFLSQFDPLWFSTWLPVVGIFGFNFNKQDSDQESNSGFIGDDKKVASKTGTYGAHSLFENATARLNSPLPQFNMSSTIPGLFKEQEGAVQAFANKMFANASAGGALRGQFSINNTPGIVGSAITNMGATLLPMISQNLQNQMLLPEQIFNQRFTNAMTPLQALISGLGSSAKGTASGFGIGAQFGSGGSGGGGGSSSGSQSSGSSAGGAG
jgi:hypothetical protein